MLHRRAVSTDAVGPGREIDNQHFSGHTIPAAMVIAVRQMHQSEVRTYLDIHARSIRGLAAQHYSTEVIEAWVVPPTEENLRGLLDNPDREIRLIAELDETPVGIGAIVLQNSELRACYVAPEASRKGIGTALVKEIERIAKNNGLIRLELHASINAERFYSALGYEVVERDEYVLPTGVRMAAVKMRKLLDAR